LSDRSSSILGNYAVKSIYGEKILPAELARLWHPPELGETFG
jgi:hypothetical protein